MLKVYKATRAVTLITYVKVEGELTTIEFTGGTLAPRRKNGHFSTTDEKVQAAIESANGYGSDFIIDTMYSDEPQPEKDLTQYKVVNEVTTVQEAKDYLIALPEITAKMVPNKEKVLEIAEKVKVTFPNLQK